MERRLTKRVDEVRQEFAKNGETCSSDAVCVQLRRKFPEYSRAKEGPLKKLVAQALSKPLAPHEGVAPAAPAVEAETAGDDGPTARRKKRARQAKQAAQPQEPQDNNLNDSLRRMYTPPQPKEPPGDEGQGARSAKQRRLMAQARREAGLPDAQKPGSFQPEPRPSERLEDLGGVDALLADLRQLIVQPLAHPEVFAHLGVQPPTGVLLHGPPGTGKTKLAHAIAGSTGVPFFKVAATEIVSGMSGESEAKIRQLFQAAIEVAPSLLFMDEVDAITPRRDSAGREMERRIVAQLLTCMDELQNTSVMVLGATNRPDALDPALRRAGRFDREIAMGIPDEKARAHILAKMTAGMRLSGSLDLPLLAKLTPGFVGADLSALTKEAALGAVSRGFENLTRLRQSPQVHEETYVDDDAREPPYTEEEMAGLAVEMEDFRLALTKVQPSSRREGFTTIPDVTWDDVGALAEVRAELDAAICEPIRKSELFRSLGLTVPVGVLLFGPPGCGKTLLAKAVANASGANFIAVKGPELLNKYVGESERAVRLVFQRALSSSPCVIFFDELDALVPRRSGEGSSGAERVVNQMLTEMDGVQQRAQVYVIAATNRPDIVDPAMLRPGRLDRLLFVPLPGPAGRLEILKAHSTKLPLAEDVDLSELANGLEGFSGADLAAVMREAAMLAIRAVPDPPPSTSEGAAAVPPAVTVTSQMLAEACTRTSASVSPGERKEYEDQADRLNPARRKKRAAAKASGAKGVADA